MPREKVRYRIVCWDTETRLEPLKRGQQIHVVNYLSARVTCTECVDGEEDPECEICSNLDGDVERTKDWFVLFDYLIILLFF